MKKYISFKFPEYNNLSIEELEKEIKKLKSIVCENYQKFEATAASKGKHYVLNFSDADARVRELNFLVGKAKPFYCRTKEQVRRVYKMPEERHKQYIEQAINEGQYIPPEVLNDYPELKEVE